MKKAFSILFTLLLIIISFRVAGPVRGDSNREDTSDDNKSAISSPSRTFYDTNLVAFNDGDPDYPAMNPRAAYFTDVAYYVTNYRNGTYSTQSNYYFTKCQIISLMQNCSIFFIHTHGSAGSIQISQDYPQLLYNYDLTSYSFSNLLCAVLLSCKGGKYIPSTTSMVQTIVNCGATCSVGFDVDISIDDGNLFAKRFAQNTMHYCYTVYNAVHYMSMANMTNSSLYNNTVIAGDSSTTLN